MRIRFAEQNIGKEGDDKTTPDEHEDLLGMRIARIRN